MASEDSEIYKISIFGKDTIFVGLGITLAIVEDLNNHLSASIYALLTDKNVELLYLQEFEQVFKSFNLRLLHKVVEPGEKSKSRGLKADIEDWLAKEGCLKDTVLIAFGGGVIGDLTGFVAATYMRGIRYVQIPTTLLAMVDSSFGGKTGINTPYGKNLVGAFHQPSRVYVDLLYLNSLSKRHISNGMSEIIKLAAVFDSEAFAYLESHSEQVFQRDTNVLLYIVTSSIKRKAAIVTEDIKDSGLRNILNFGHSVGHALEILAPFCLLHGEAVAIGMFKEAEISRSLGYCRQATVNRLSSCLSLYGLKTAVPTNLNVTDIMRYLRIDKKNTTTGLRLIMIKSIGGVASPFLHVVDDTLVEVALSSLIEVKPKEAIHGTVAVPGSKSISNRALCLAALGSGPCMVKGILHADDTLVMCQALQALGVRITRAQADDCSLTVHGVNGQLSPPKSEIYVGSSGTTARFIASLVTLIVDECEVVITGSSRMKERPIGPLVEALQSTGARIEYMEQPGALPIKLHCGGGFKGGTVEIRSDVSSQFFSSLLLCAPHAKEETTLLFSSSKRVSQRYIDLTLQVMHGFGSVVETLPSGYVVPKLPYLNPPVFIVEDASSATYHMAIAAISSGRVTVSNVGRKSLQGDTAFCYLLQLMGCRVEQTDQSTTVSGPEKGRLSAVSINMTDMTDSFMTAAVLCAVAEGTSSLYGIANQRFKESNRIIVMAEELRKLGVHAEELPDGLEITGRNHEELKGCVVNCHEDHRIAMSFAVLGCLVKGVILNDKACVSKTYPEFWDHLQTFLGVGLAVPALRLAPCLRTRSGLSLILIGMRGVGKSRLGATLAKDLGFSLIDLDSFIEEKIGQTILEYVVERGWPSFRDLELYWFKTIMTNQRYQCGHVIVTGGGLVENKSARSLLKAHNFVIELRRDIEDLATSSDVNGKRPSLEEELRAIYAKRKKWYSNCRTFLFPIRRGEEEWDEVRSELVSFCRRVANDYVKPPKPATASFFVCCTFSNPSASGEELREICVGADYIELRVDLLEDPTEDFICQQVAHIRRCCGIPIIFTVRSRRQGGIFSGSEEEQLALLLLGAELGCEYIDVEVTLSDASIVRIITEKKASFIMLSYHAPEFSETFGWSALQTKFSLYHEKWQVDVFKVVIQAESMEDVFQLRQLATLCQQSVPVTLVAGGEKGTLSRVLNTFMNPVTHPLLPFPAFPGQLTIKQINTIRSSIGLLNRKEYCLYGKPVALSLSPLIHNSIFEELGLPHSYTIHETDNVDAVAEELKHQPTTIWGCSITIPLKEKAVQIVDKLTPEASEIGAINTIIREESGHLIGDNTDWLGIVRCLKRAAKKCKLKILNNKNTALVVGAGGTAKAAVYALKKLKFTTIYVYNRTKVSAHSLARRFNVFACDSLSEVELMTFDVVISTLPNHAEVNLPEKIILCKPVFFQVSYKATNLEFLRKLFEGGCKLIGGEELLIYQGLEQSKRWTGTQVLPERTIRAKLHERCGSLYITNFF